LGQKGETLAENDSTAPNSVIGRTC